jgi:excisionase family DNA binding protein
MFIEMQEAADRMGVGLDEIEKMIREGILGVRKEPGRPTLLRADEIDTLAQILSPATAQARSPKPPLF